MYTTGNQNKLIRTKMTIHNHYVYNNCLKEIILTIKAIEAFKLKAQGVADLSGKKGGDIGM